MKKNLIVVLVVFAGVLGLATYVIGNPWTTSTDGAAAAPSVNGESSKIVTLSIEGMTCGACEIAVKRVLRAVNGVRSVDVSFEKKNAVVTYDPTKVAPETIARTLEEKLPTYKAKVVK